MIAPAMPSVAWTTTAGMAVGSAAGKVIKLTPGQTWVELPDTTYSVTKTP